jgi:hypothetical protein
MGNTTLITQSVFVVFKKIPIKPMIRVWRSS